MVCEFKSRRMSSYEFKSEDIAAGMPGFISPISVNFSPDGNLLTYLFPDSSGKRTIFCLNDFHQDSTQAPYKLFDPSTESNDTLTLEEQLRRERMRLFTSGISSYEWSSFEGKQWILIPLGDKLYLYDETATEDDKKTKMIYDGSLGAPIDPHLSPNGQSVAFVIKNNLYVHHFTSNASGAPIQLTIEGNDKTGISYGTADYVAQEEMSRYRGFWWSPNNSQIVLTVNDESMIPSYEILHQGKSDPKHAEYHRYPFAGKENPFVKLAVLTVPHESVTTTVDLTWMELIDNSDERFHNVLKKKEGEKPVSEYYVCRAGWWPDGSVMVQVENREQNLLQLLRVDPQTGQRSIVLEETTKVWINLHDMLTPLSASFRVPNVEHHEGDFYFLWVSERSGFAQIYLYHYDAAQHVGVNLTTALPLSGGENWVVESIDAVDETNNIVYFSGNYAAPTERHLFRASLLPSVSLEQTQFMRLTNHAAFHTCQVNYQKGVFVDVCSDLKSPIKMTLHHFDAMTGACNHDSSRVIIDNLSCDMRIITKPSLFASILPPTIHTIRSKDGEVDLICAVYMPPGFSLDDYLLRQSSSSLPSFPTIMSVYGGPHVQRVMQHWSVTADLRAQRMAQLGMVVIKCDNRGSYRRGLQFEGAIQHDMGNIEVVDQVTAVEYFTSIGLVDATRVGMFGWSYGGYMSAMSLCRAADTFKCAVAGAPVTSWDGYDTHYTERYMGHPEVNVKGYEESSVMHHVSKMKGHLLLVHGLIDENVHFRHTARLINALITERKRYELIMFPCERHAPHKLQDKVYLEDIMMEFFVKYLSPVVLDIKDFVVVNSSSAASAPSTPAVESPSANSASSVKLTSHL